MDDRRCLQDILYVLHQDITWQLLPMEQGFASGQAYWRCLDRWQPSPSWATGIVEFEAAFPPHGKAFELVEQG